MEAEVTDESWRYIAVYIGTRAGGRRFYCDFMQMHAHAARYLEYLYF